MHVYVSVCVCMYVYVCTIMSSCMYVCMYVCMCVYVCMHVCIYDECDTKVCMYVCMHVWQLQTPRCRAHAYVCMYECVHIYIHNDETSSCLCVRAHVRLNIYIHIIYSECNAHETFFCVCVPLYLHMYFI